MSMARSARSVRSPVGTPRASSPSSTFCWTVSHGISAKVWKTIEVSRLVPVRRRPRNCTSPSVGAIRPAMHRSSVDLPLPLRPSSATNSPSATSRLMSSSTGSGRPPGPEKDLLSDRTLISGVARPWPSWRPRRAGGSCERVLRLGQLVQPSPQQRVQRGDVQGHDQQAGE